ncbi:MAG: hypothetical protein V4550_12360 [Gemmatimonadota bacterium]
MKRINPVAPATLAVALAIVLALACSASDTSDAAFTGELAEGTWGGDSGGLIVGDTALHLHVGCTFGDISGKLNADAQGNFSVAGSYVVRAYPIQVGPAVPAQFTGHASAKTVTITATINDTVAHQTLVRGPVTLSLGVEPRLGPCPICRDPFTGASRRAP